MKAQMRGFSIPKRVISLIVVVCFLTTNAMAAPIETAAYGVRSTAAEISFKVPAGLGSVVETYTAPSTEYGVRSTEYAKTVSRDAVRLAKAAPWGPPYALPRTVIYIQDAHDSLEAQENIAAMVRLCVKNYGVKTVYEEGYEGPVPTDELFGRIKDPALKEKVSYYLMDKLRVGGAEYAHINRTAYGVRSTANKKTGEPYAVRLPPYTDWQLIGADDINLHLENIRAYEQAAKSRGDVTRDTQKIRKELQKLIDKNFPKEIKAWLKLKERFSRGEMPLVEYLQRTYKVRSTEYGVRRKNENTNSPYAVHLPPYQNVEALLSGDRKQMKQINLMTLMGEIQQLEDEISEQGLPEERDRKTYGYYQSILLLEKLNSIELSHEGFTALKGSLEGLKTEDVARFLAKESHRSIVLFRSWEDLIADSIRFYELAKLRDLAIEKILSQTNDQRPATSDEKRRQSLVDSRQSPKTKTDVSVLVFGGFHKEAIKRILKEKGISYVILSPAIGAPNKRHEDYYRMLMGGGKYAFEKAARRTEYGEQKKQPFETPYAVHRTQDVAKESTRARTAFTMNYGPTLDLLAATGAQSRNKPHAEFILDLDQMFARRAEAVLETPGVNTIRAETRSDVMSFREALFSNMDYQAASSGNRPIFVSGVRDEIAQEFAQKHSGLDAMDFSAWVQLCKNKGRKGVQEFIKQKEGLCLYGFRPSTEEALEALGYLRGIWHETEQSFRIIVLSEAECDLMAYSDEERSKLRFPLENFMTFFHYTGPDVRLYEPRAYESQALNFPTSDGAGVRSEARNGESSEKSDETKALPENMEIKTRSPWRFFLELQKNLIWDVIPLWLAVAALGVTQKVIEAAPGPMPFLKNAVPFIQSAVLGYLLSLHLHIFVHEWGHFGMLEKLRPGAAYFSIPEQDFFGKVFSVGYDGDLLRPEEQIKVSLAAPAWACGADMALLVTGAIASQSWFFPVMMATSLLSGIDASSGDIQKFFQARKILKNRSGQETRSKERSEIRAEAREGSGSFSIFPEKVPDPLSAIKGTGTIFKNKMEPVPARSETREQENEEIFAIQKKKIIRLAAEICSVAAGAFLLHWAVYGLTGFSLWRAFREAQQSQSWLSALVAAGISLGTGISARILGMRLSDTATRRSPRVIFAMFGMQTVWRPLLGAYQAAVNWFIDAHFTEPALRAIVALGLVIPLSAFFDFFEPKILGRLDAKLRQAEGDPSRAEEIRSDLLPRRQFWRVLDGVMGRQVSSYLQHAVTQNWAPLDLRPLILFGIGFFNNIFRSNMAFAKGRRLSTKGVVRWALLVSAGCFFVSVTTGLTALVLTAISAYYFSRRNRAPLFSETREQEHKKTAWMSKKAPRHATFLAGICAVSAGLFLGAFLSRISADELRYYFRAPGLVAPLLNDPGKRVALAGDYDIHGTPPAGYVAMLGQRSAARTEPLYTDSLATCAALVIDEAKNNKHFLAHWTAANSADEIRDAVLKEFGRQKVLKATIVEGSDSGKDGLPVWDPGRSSTVKTIAMALDSLEITNVYFLPNDHASEADGNKVLIHEGRLLRPVEGTSIPKKAGSGPSRSEVRSGSEPSARDLKDKIDAGWNVFKEALESGALTKGQRSGVWREVFPIRIALSPGQIFDEKLTSIESLGEIPEIAGLEAAPLIGEAIRSLARLVNLDRTAAGQYIKQLNGLVFRSEARADGDFSPRGIAATDVGKESSFAAYQRALDLFLDASATKEYRAGGTFLRIDPFIFGSLATGQIRPGLYPEGISYEQASEIQIEGKESPADSGLTLQGSPSDYPSDIDLYIRFETDNPYVDILSLSSFFQPLIKQIFEQERVLIHLNYKPASSPMLAAKDLKGKGLLDLLRSEGEIPQSLKDALLDKFPEGSEVSFIDLDTGQGYFPPAFSEYLTGLGYRVRDWSATESNPYWRDRAPAGIREKIVPAYLPLPQEIEKLPKHAFDIVTVNNIDGSAADLAKTARELLKPGGILLLTLDATVVRNEVDQEILAEIRGNGFDAVLQVIPDDYPKYQTPFTTQKLIRAVPRSEAREVFEAALKLFPGIEFPEMWSMYFKRDELEKISRNIQSLREIYPQLTPFERSVLLKPDFLGVLVGVKPVYLSGYLESEDGNMEQAELMRVLREEAVQKILDSHKFPDVISAGRIFFSGQAVRDRLKKEGRFLVAEGVLTEEELLRFSGPGPEAVESLRSFLREFKDGENQERSILEGFLMGCAQEDILYYAATVGAGALSSKEEQSILGSEYGFVLLSRDPMRAWGLVRKWDIGVDLAYQTLRRDFADLPALLPGSVAETFSRFYRSEARGTETRTRTFTVNLERGFYATPAFLVSRLAQELLKEEIAVRVKRPADPKFLKAQETMELIAFGAAVPVGGKLVFRLSGREKPGTLKRILAVFGSILRKKEMPRKALIKIGNGEGDFGVYSRRIQAALVPGYRSASDPNDPMRLRQKRDASARSEARRREVFEKIRERVGYPRVAAQGLLNTHYVLHDLMILQAVNPEMKPVRALYGGAGADLSNLLLSTDAAEAYFISDYHGLSSQGMKRLESPEGREKLMESMLSRSYSDKKGLGYAINGTLQNSLFIEAALAFELEALGATDVSVDESLPFPNLSFKYQHPLSQESKERRIFFIEGDVTRPSTYEKILGQNFDIYYQRAGEGIPLTYSRDDNFILTLDKHLVPGGFFITDDYSYDSSVYDPLGEAKFQDEGKKFPLPYPAISVHIPEELKTSILHLRSGGKRDVSGDHYGWDLRVREKPLSKAEFSASDRALHNDIRSEARGQFPGPNWKPAREMSPPGWLMRGIEGLDEAIYQDIRQKGFGFPKERPKGLENRTFFPDAISFSLTKDKTFKNSALQDFGPGRGHGLSKRSATFILDPFYVQSHQASFTIVGESILLNDIVGNYSESLQRSGLDLTRTHAYENIYHDEIHASSPVGPEAIWGIVVHPDMIENILAWETKFVAGKNSLRIFTVDPDPLYVGVDTPEVDKKILYEWSPEEIFRSEARSRKEQIDLFLENERTDNVLRPLTIRKFVYGIVATFAGIALNGGKAAKIGLFASLWISFTVLRNVLVDLAAYRKVYGLWRLEAIRKRKFANDLFFVGFAGPPIVASKIFISDALSRYYGWPGWGHAVADFVVVSIVGGLWNYFQRLARNYSKKVAFRDAFRSPIMSFGASGFFTLLYLLRLTKELIPSAAAFAVARRPIGELWAAYAEYGRMVKFFQDEKAARSAAASRSEIRLSTPYTPGVYMGEERSEARQNILSSARARAGTKEVPAEARNESGATGKKAWREALNLKREQWLRDTISKIPEGTQGTTRLVFLKGLLEQIEKAGVGGIGLGRLNGIIYANGQSLLKLIEQKIVFKGRGVQKKTPARPPPETRILKIDAPWKERLDLILRARALAPSVGKTGNGRDLAAEAKVMNKRYKLPRGAIEDLLAANEKPVEGLEAFSQAIGNDWAPIAEAVFGLSPEKMKSLRIPFNFVFKEPGTFSQEDPEAAFYMAIAGYRLLTNPSLGEEWFAKIPVGEIVREGSPILSRLTEMLKEEEGTWRKQRKWSGISNGQMALLMLESLPHKKILKTAFLALKFVERKALTASSYGREWFKDLGILEEEETLESMIHPADLLRIEKEKAEFPDLSEAGVDPEDAAEAYRSFSGTAIRYAANALDYNHGKTDPAADDLTEAAFRRLEELYEAVPGVIMVPREEFMSYLGEKQPEFEANREKLIKPFEDLNDTQKAALIEWHESRRSEMRSETDWIKEVQWPDPVAPRPTLSQKTEYISKLLDIIMALEGARLWQGDGAEENWAHWANHSLGDYLNNVTMNLSYHLQAGREFSKEAAKEIQEQMQFADAIWSVRKRLAVAIAGEFKDSPEILQTLPEGKGLSKENPFSRRELNFAFPHKVFVESPNAERNRAVYVEAIRRMEGPFNEILEIAQEKLPGYKKPGFRRARAPKPGEATLAARPKLDLPKPEQPAWVEKFFGSAKDIRLEGKFIGRGKLYAKLDELLEQIFTGGKALWIGLEKRDGRVAQPFRITEKKRSYSGSVKNLNISQEYRNPLQEFGVVSFASADRQSVMVLVVPAFRIPFYLSGKFRSDLPRSEQKIEDGSPTQSRMPQETSSSGVRLPAGQAGVASDVVAGEVRSETREEETLREILLGAPALGGILDPKFGKVISMRDLWRDITKGQKKALISEIRQKHFGKPDEDFLRKKVEASDGKEDIFLLVSPQGELEGSVETKRFNSENAFFYGFWASPRDGKRGTFLLEKVLGRLKAEKIKNVHWDTEASAAGFYHRFFAPRMDYETFQNRFFLGRLDTWGELSPEALEEQERYLEAVFAREAAVREAVAVMNLEGDEFLLQNKGGFLDEARIFVDKEKGKWKISGGRGSYHALFFVSVPPSADNPRDKVIYELIYTTGASLSKVGPAGKLSQLLPESPIKHKQRVSPDQAVRSSVSAEGRIRPKLFDEAGKAPRPNNVGRVREILTNGKRRPEPLEAASLTEEDIKAGAKLVLPNENIDDLFTRVRGSVMWQELEHLLPFVNEAVRAALADYPGHRIIVVGRDGEIFYDALQALGIHERDPGKVQLMPLSQDLAARLMRRIPQTLMKGNESKFLKEFLTQYGLTKKAIRSGQKFLVLDSGFKGTMARDIRAMVRKAWGWALSDEQVEASIRGALMGTWELEHQPSYQASVLKQFTISAEELRKLFPRTYPLTARFWKGPDHAANIVIAATLQLLPHYHEKVDVIERKADGSVEAVPLQPARFDWGLDTPHDFNTSLVNPLAALLVQKRTVEYFRGLQNSRSEVREGSGSFSIFQEKVPVPYRSEVRKDYYQVLELPRKATDTEIKKRYRQLAMEFHPDRNQGDKSAEARFKEIGEAYEVLSDPQKREAYDRWGQEGLQQARQEGDENPEMDSVGMVFDLLNSLPEIHPKVEAWMSAWKALLDTSRPHWKKRGDFPYPYDPEQAVIAYDPEIVRQKPIGALRQLFLEDPPERNLFHKARADGSSEDGRNFLRDLPNAFWQESGEDGMALIPNRYPREAYDSLLISRKWHPQFPSRKFLSTEMKWVDWGAVTEFHRSRRYVDHYHTHVLFGDRAPITRFGGQFKAAFVTPWAEIGELKGYPIPHIALASRDPKKHASAVYLFHQLLEKEKRFYYRASLKDHDSGQFLTLFFVFDDYERTFDFNVTGLIRSFNKKLTAEEVYGSFHQHFLGPRDLSSIVQAFQSQSDARAEARESLTEISEDKIIFKGLRSLDPQSLTKEEPAIKGKGVLKIDWDAAGQFQKLTEFLYENALRYGEGAEADGEFLYDTNGEFVQRTIIRQKRISKPDWKRIKVNARMARRDPANLMSVETRSERGGITNKGYGLSHFADFALRWPVRLEYSRDPEGGLTTTLWGKVAFLQEEAAGMAKAPRSEARAEAREPEIYVAMSAAPDQSEEGMIRAAKIALEVGGDAIHFDIRQGLYFNKIRKENGNKVDPDNTRYLDPEFFLKMKASGVPEGFQDLHLLYWEPPQEMLIALAKTGMFRSIDVQKNGFSSPALLVETLKTVRSLGLKAGVVIESKESVAQIPEEVLSQSDSVMFTAVETGKVGAITQKEVLEKARELRERGFQGLIADQGGINTENIVLARQLGADIFVVGTDILANKNGLSPAAAIRALRAALSEAQRTTDPTRSEARQDQRAAPAGKPNTVILLLKVYALAVAVSPMLAVDVLRKAAFHFLKRRGNARAQKGPAPEARSEMPLKLSSRTSSPQDVGRIRPALQADQSAAEVGRRAEMQFLDEAELRRVLDEGRFAVISAGPNLSERKDMEKNRGQLAERSGRMRAELEKIKNVRIYEVTGRDDMPQEEKGFLVIKKGAEDEAKFRGTMLNVAKDFAQDSVSFSLGKKNEIAFTDGQSLYGEGYQFIKEGADFYTAIRLASGGTVRFALNINDPFPSKALKPLNSNPGFERGVNRAEMPLKLSSRTSSPQDVGRIRPALQADQPAAEVGRRAEMRGRSFHGAMVLALSSAFVAANIFFARDYEHFMKEAGWMSRAALKCFVCGVSVSVGKYISQWIEVYILKKADRIQGDKILKWGLAGLLVSGPVTYWLWLDFLTYLPASPFVKAILGLTFYTLVIGNPMKFWLQKKIEGRAEAFKLSDIFTPQKTGNHFWHLYAWNFGIWFPVSLIGWTWLKEYMVPITAVFSLAWAALYTGLLNRWAAVPSPVVIDLSARGFEKPSEFKVVFFDIGNVLLRGDGKKTARNLAQYCNRSEREISDALESATNGDKRLYEKGMLSGEEFFRGIKEKLGLSMDYGTFVRVYTEKFSVIEESAEILRQLKAAGYKIGVISEIGRISSEYVRSKFPEVFGNVDPFVASCDAGMMKDDPAIFDKALKDSGFSAEEAVFIDDLEQNIAVAERQKIKGVRFVAGKTDLFQELKKVLDRSRHERSEAREKKQPSIREDIRARILKMWQKPIPRGFQAMPDATLEALIDLAVDFRAAGFSKKKIRASLPGDDEIAYLKAFSGELAGWTQSPEILGRIRKSARIMLDQKEEPHALIVHPILSALVKTRDDLAKFSSWLDVIDELLRKNLAGMNEFDLAERVKGSETSEALRKALMEEGWLERSAGDARSEVRKRVSAGLKAPYQVTKDITGFSMVNGLYLRDFEHFGAENYLYKETDLPGQAANRLWKGENVYITVDRIDIPQKKASISVYFPDGAVETRELLADKTTELRRGQFFFAITLKGLEEKHLKVELKAARGSYRSAEEFLQKNPFYQRSIQDELRAAVNALSQIINLRQWMDQHDAKGRPVLICQVMQLGGLYPLFSKALKERFGVLEISPAELKELVARKNTKELAKYRAARFLLFKLHYGSSYGGKTDDDESRWLLKDFADLISAGVLLIDYSSAVNRSPAEDKISGAQMILKDLFLFDKNPVIVSRRDIGNLSPEILRKKYFTVIFNAALVLYELSRMDNSLFYDAFFGFHPEMNELERYVVIDGVFRDISSLIRQAYSDATLEAVENDALLKAFATRFDSPRSGRRSEDGSLPAGQAGVASGVVAGEVRSEAREKRTPQTPANSQQSYDEVVAKWVAEGRGNVFVKADDGRTFEFRYQEEDSGSPDLRNYRVELYYQNDKIGVCHFMEFGKPKFAQMNYAFPRHASTYATTEQGNAIHVNKLLPADRFGDIVDEKGQHKYGLLGQSLMGFALRIAQKTGMRKFYAQEVKAPDFFQRIGFRLMEGKTWIYDFQNKATKVPAIDIKRKTVRNNDQAEAQKHPRQLRELSRVDETSDGRRSEARERKDDQVPPAVIKRIDMTDLTIDVRAMGLGEIFHRLALAVEQFCFAEAGTPYGNKWKRLWDKVQGERPRYFHELIAEIARRVQMSLPDGWNEEDGRALINRLAYDDSVRDTADRTKQLPANEYFVRMKKAVQERLELMPRDRVQSVRELHLGDALYNPKEGTFRIVKTMSDNAERIFADGIDNGSSAGLSDDNVDGNWYRVHDAGSAQKEMSDERPALGAKDVRFESRVPSPVAHNAVRNALAVRNRIEKLTGSGTILMSRVEIAALTNEQWEEFFIVASAVAEGRKDVRIVLYGETAEGSAAREEELRNVEGLKFSVAESGMEAAFKKFGIPGKAAVDLLGRTARRERHPLVKSLRLDERSGLITLALLYVLSDGKEKAVTESSEGELTVRAELRAVLQDYLSQQVVAWAA